MATTEVSGKAAPANFKSEYMSQEDREYVLEWVVSRSVEIILSQLPFLNIFPTISTRRNIDN